jgi:flagellar basal-body rod modification protein FlgD
MDVTAANGTSASNESAAAVNPKSGLADKEAFLQLLVAQLKNQDPLNPTDGVEFLTQLAQFTEVEQLIGIRDEIKALRNDAAAAAPESAAIRPTA